MNKQVKTKMEQELDEIYDWSTEKLWGYFKDTYKDQEIKITKEHYEQVKDGITLKFPIVYWIERDKYWVHRLNKRTYNLIGAKTLIKDTALYDEIDDRKYIMRKYIKQALQFDDIVKEEEDYEE